MTDYIAKLQLFQIYKVVFGKIITNALKYLFTVFKILTIISTVLVKLYYILKWF